MKPSSAGTVKAFATMRVVGDDLDPKAITKLLKVTPTISYRKGQRYSAGPRTGDLIGRTGLWLYSTDDNVPGNIFQKHVGALYRLLVPMPGNFGPLANLHQLMKDQGLKAHITFFWHGRPGAEPPEVPDVVAKFFKLLPADLELDFDADEETPRRRVA